MKFKTCLLFIIFPLVSYSAVTIDVQVAELLDSSGAEVSTSSYAIIVADTGNDGFLGQYTSALDADASVFTSTTLSVGQTIGGSSNDEIIGVFQPLDFGSGVIGINGSISNLDITGGNVAAGQDLALFWFPTVTTASITSNVAQYGFYRSDTVDTGAAAPVPIAFFVPSDGTSTDLWVFDSILDTTAPDPSMLTAVVPVPEPAVYSAVIGLCSLLLVFYRRK